MAAKTKITEVQACELIRCDWCSSTPLYTAYHDEEWGVPKRERRRLFEDLILDGFQAGLSWRTILEKRENFRRAFDNFEPEKVARYSEKKQLALLEDAGIVRNRQKIAAAIGNARALLNLEQARGQGFSEYVWSYVDNKPRLNRFASMSQIPAKTELSDQLSKDLLKQGFKFVGSTIVYAFMQAVGMVNDHIVTCHRWKEVQKL